MSLAEEYQIISIDGGRLYRELHTIKNKNNFPIRKGLAIDESAFSGVLNRSLETEKLLEVYKKCRTTIGRSDYKKLIKREKNPILPLLVDVYFKYPCREFNKFSGEEGTKYVRFGYDASNSSEWSDHCAFRYVNGEKLLIGIEVADKKAKKEQSTSSKKKQKKAYQDVKNNQLPENLNEYFTFTDNQYKKTSKEFPYIKDIIEEQNYEMNSENIRRYFYNNGFNLDDLHFVRYKRSAGSSRNGHCLFIAEPLLEGMMKWTSCGLKETVKKDIVSWEAYSALTLSDMKWPLSLSKKSILIMRDEYNTFCEKVICIKKGKKKELCSEETELKVTNNIWDGEGLLEASCFQELAEKFPYSKENSDNRFDRCGMLLLRNRFFKTCAFRTKIQEWFADNHITKVSQLNGYTEATDIKDIKLIVTDSSIKYFKLCGIGEDSPKTKFERVAKEYLKNLFGREEETTFGIVKTDKPTHHMDGDMVRTSYQLLSTIGLTKEEVTNLYKPSLDYLLNIKTSPMFMRHYLNQIIREIPIFEENTEADIENDVEAENENMESEDVGEEIVENEEECDVSSDSCTSKAIMEVLKYRDDFSQTKFYKDFLNSVRNSFRDRIRRGRILVNGTYATLLGNGAEMLYASIGKDYKESRENFLQKEQIYTKKFPFNTRLLCARSPHITMGNLLLTNNTKCPFYDKYFELSPEIVCVNAIENNIQNRLNGCDYDSDTMLITDNEILVKGAERTFDEFSVPVCNMESEKRKGLDVATVDIDIANNKIGSIVNLSQYLNAKYWNTRESNPEQAKEIYKKICVLAVMSGMEIDKAKRHYAIKVDKELKRLGEEKTTNPEFYAFITKQKRKTDKSKMNSTMSYVYDECAETEEKPYEKTKRLSELVDFPTAGDGSNDYKYAGKIREAVKAFRKEINKIRYRQRSNNGQGIKNLHKEKQDVFEKCKKEVEKNLKTDGVLLEILKDLDDEGRDHEISNYQLFLFSFMVLDKNKRFIKRIIEGPQTLENLKRDEKHGTIDIYGHKHRIEIVERAK